MSEVPLYMRLCWMIRLQRQAGLLMEAGCMGSKRSSIDFHRPSAHFVFETPASSRGNSLIRNNAPLGPYSRTMPRALRWS